MNDNHASFSSLVPPGRSCPGVLEIALFLAFILGACIDRPVNAGISGENVIVVVNGDSLASRTIANHYVELRQIPHNNVVILEDVPKGIRVSLDDFRDRILTPVLQTINRRKLGRQSKVIAYSAGFPTGVNIQSHHKLWEKDPGLKKLQRPVASINGLTYFYQFAIADNPSYLELGSNLYARNPFEQYFANPFTGEVRSQYQTAISEFKTKKFAEAAASFEAIFKLHPTLAPIAIRAAEAHAKAGNKEDAVRLVKKAIQAGWWSKRYLQENDDLAGLLKDPALSGVAKLMDDSAPTMQLPASFSNRKGWTSCGFPTPGNKGGMAYMMSCSLAVVGENASTLDQAVRVLRRAASADRTHPRGEFRFANTSDVRCKTRFPNIANALLYLNEAGFQTEVFLSKLPTKPGTVSGMMLGAATVNFANQPWEFAPGAICESLTSLGGDYTLQHQTKVTTYLHAGAAMTSGTVTEPYSIQAKFPLPMMYAYYASGASAIESFYQSVHSPYMLLIVGDPVCQPFANPPAEWLDISLVPSAAKNNQKRVRFARRRLGNAKKSTYTKSIEIYVGGRFIRTTPPANVEIKLPADASGVGLIRGVLIGVSPNEPQLAIATEVDLKGPLPAPVAKITQSRTLPRADKFTDGANSKRIRVSLTCPQADSIELKHHGEVVGTIQGDSGEISVDASQLGGGPLRFAPTAYFGEKRVRGFSIVDDYDSALP